MKTTLTIAQKDFRSYFNSPMAYIVLSVFLLISGYLFFSTLFLSGYASMRNYFAIAPILFVIFGPAITMRLISEEKKTGTIEQLLTLPVRHYEIILGKFLASLGIVLVGLFCTLPYVISMSFIVASDAQIDYGPILGGYFGFILLASAFIAMGIFASSLTKNQVVAFIIGLLLCFFFYFIDKFAVLAPPYIGAVMQYLSVDYHFTNISRGVLDSRDIIYYLSLIIISMVLADYCLRRDKK